MTTTAVVLIYAIGSVVTYIFMKLVEWFYLEDRHPTWEDVRFRAGVSLLSWIGLLMVVAIFVGLWLAKQCKKIEYPKFPPKWL